jgi:CDP-diacylglycerol--serine O-phosphatidyltransferase
MQYLYRMRLFTVANIITLGNLLCGILAIFSSFAGNLIMAAYLVLLAAVLDFFDGFAARILKQPSEIGKQLDSLADVISFGLVPGIAMYHLILRMEISAGVHDSLLPFVALIIPLFSALRLAKFNVDTRQSDSFIGVPTPANAMLMLSIPLVMEFTLGIGSMSDLNHKDWKIDRLVEEVSMLPYMLSGLCVVMSILLIAELPLFALKFKSFGWKGNEIRFIFLGISLVMLVVLQVAAIPLIIIVYILMSFVNNLVSKK